MDFEYRPRKNIFKYIVIAFSSLVIICATICICVLAPILSKAQNQQAKVTSAVYDESQHIKILPLQENQTALSGADIYDKLASSIVDISARSLLSQGMDGAGTGIIISSDGYILTNAHVVRDADTLTVKMSNGEKHPATLVGMDEYLDVAVISIKKVGLVAAELGEYNGVKIGDKVYAIGNATGTLSHSFTQGLVSGLERAVNVEINGKVKKMQNLIQTDASINPGNSGGALLNELGQVIGINSFRLAEDGIIGIGFAIPVSLAKISIDSIIDIGYMPRAALLINVRSYALAQGSRKGNIPLQGVYIEEILQGSPLENSEISIGDIIVAADGKEITSNEDLADAINKHKPGEEIILLIANASDGVTNEYTFIMADSSK